MLSSDSTLFYFCLDYTLIHQWFEYKIGILGDSLCTVIIYICTGISGSSTVDCVFALLMHVVWQQHNIPAIRRYTRDISISTTVMEKLTGTIIQLYIIRARHCNIGNINCSPSSFRPEFLTYLFASIIVAPLIHRTMITNTRSNLKSNVAPLRNNTITIAAKVVKKPSGQHDNQVSDAPTVTLAPL